MELEALIARGVQVLIALGGAYLLALWFVLAVWVFRDIEARSRSVVTQVFSTLLVVLFWVPGLFLYWILRPKETLDEAYQRSLEEEYLVQDLEELPLCPSCQHYVEDDYRICPHCTTQLRDNCPSCERLIDLRWEICPYCGDAQHGHTHDHTLDDVTVPADRWVDPESIEKRLRDAEERRIREETRALPAATAASADDTRSPGEPRQIAQRQSANGRAVPDETEEVMHGPDIDALRRESEAEREEAREQVEVPRGPRR